MRKDDVLAMLWKAAQFIVWVGFTVLIYEGVGRELAAEKGGPVMAASMIIALALTAGVFAPILHFTAWLGKPSRQKERGGPPVPR